MAAPPLPFYSTNRSAPDVTLRDALLQGQAADRGLFCPSAIPPFSRAELAALVGRSYPEIAHVVLRRFTAGVIDDARLPRCARTPTTTTCRSSR